MAKSDMSDSEEDGKKSSADNGFSCSSAKNMKKSSADNGFGCSSAKNVKKKFSDTTLDSSSESICVLSKPPQISTPLSIFVASMIKNLVAYYEKDRDAADLKYKHICDTMRKMEVMDESYQMKEFESILMKYRYLFIHLLTANDSTIQLEAAWHKCLFISHYHREFDELEFIAGGGFGKVYRVRHKLDGNEYAVKKIGIRSDGIQNVKNYLSEVKTFSSINHPNVVQYKAAWIDMNECVGDAVPTEDEDEEEFVSMETTSRKCQQYVYNKTETSNSLLDKPKEDSSDFEIVFEKSVSKMETQYNTSSSYLEKKSTTRRTKRTSVSEGGLALRPLNQKEIDEIRKKQKKEETWATLYIQMELCQLTLKQWLSQRNSSGQPVDPMKALVPVKIVQDAVVQEILEQLLQGLQYIHYKEVVHHDIKTSNIFIRRENEQLVVQLGDFGLACPLQSAHHMLAFGTKLYAAPEQLAGKCDAKSDMYSLGIVLFELVETFTTDMERTKYIEELKRTRKLPPRVEMQHPKFANIIKRLVVKSPEERPTAKDLLSEISINSNAKIQEMKTKLAEKENQLSEKDEEILRLKQLLISAGITNDVN